MSASVRLICSFVRKNAKRRQTAAAGRCAMAIVRRPSETCRLLERIEDGVELSHLRRMAVSMLVPSGRALLLRKRL